VVTDILVGHFGDIVQVDFTARLEEELDDIADGKARWVGVVREFYEPFIEDVERAKDKISPPAVVLPELCPLCPEEGREPAHLEKKLGRYGYFIGCGNYPECRYTRPLEGSNGAPEPKPTGETCPKCGEGQLVERVGRFGPFIGCDRYPECTYIKKEPPKRTGVTCPECKQGELVERRGRFGPFFSCERFPECRFSLNQQPLPDPCEACGGLVVRARKGASRCIACHRAWDADGTELPEAEAQALIPKPRAPRARARRSA